MKVKAFIKKNCRPRVYNAIARRQNNDYIEANLLGFNYLYYATEDRMLKFNALKYSISTTRRHRMVAEMYDVLDQLNEVMTKGADCLTIGVK